MASSRPVWIRKRWSQEAFCAEALTTDFFLLFVRVALGLASDRRQCPPFLRQYFRYLGLGMTGQVSAHLGQSISLRIKLALRYENS